MSSATAIYTADEGVDLWAASNASVPPLSSSFVHNVGRKAANLTLVPHVWRLPYLSVQTRAFRSWRSAGAGRRSQILRKLGEDLMSRASSWSPAWPNGIILRSSSTEETLRERGAFRSQALAADYGPDVLSREIERIWEHYAQIAQSGEIAVLVQPLIAGLGVMFGHASNERRVSRTLSQWRYEVERPSPGEGRLDCSRIAIPPLQPMTARNQRVVLSRLRQVLRWCVSLGKGPCHIEWARAHDRLWILQIDFEDETPDDGCDPRSFIRLEDHTLPRPLPAGSPLQAITPTLPDTGWRKVSLAQQLSRDRSHPFPPLYFIGGVQLANALSTGYPLGEDVERITSGRAVCRTDCRSNSTRLNLPRTDSVQPERAVQFMQDTAAEFSVNGVAPDDLCFILHKFIPARSASWAVADQNRQVVVIDSLWGVPDGLAFLSHDSFEYDVVRDALSSERIRYKRSFIQETADGTWEEVKVRRRLARMRSLSESAVREIAQHTHRLARSYRGPISVMWFCDIPEQVGVGPHVPWFAMPAPEHALSGRFQPAPRLPRLIVRDHEDLDAVPRDDGKNYVLSLDPDVTLVRDETFIHRVADVARASSLTVELNGSSLGHAYYTLERRGITVALADEPSYSRARARRRQVFRKLVRDSLPSQIRERGERVAVARIGRSEARRALLVKLLEESMELLEAKSHDDVCFELADVLEVLRSVANATGVDWEMVESSADAKRRDRGSFAEGYVLLETSWPNWLSQNEDVPHTISLARLANIVTHPSGALVNFAALLSREGRASVTLSGDRRVGVALTLGGLELETQSKVSAELYDTAQLAFPFFKSELA